MKASSMFLMIAGVAGIGAAVFFATREASAKEAAKQAIRINGDCDSIDVVDTDALQKAIRDAAVAVAPAPSDNAADAFRKVFAMLTNCPEGRDPSIRVPGRPPVRYSQIIAFLEPMTIAEALKRVLQLAGGMQGAAEPGVELVAREFLLGLIPEARIGVGGTMRRKTGNLLYELPPSALQSAIENQSAAPFSRWLCDEKQCWLDARAPSSGVAVGGCHAPRAMTWYVGPNGGLIALGTDESGKAFASHADDIMLGVGGDGKIVPVIWPERFRVDSATRSSTPSMFERLQTSTR